MHTVLQGNVHSNDNHQLTVNECETPMKSHLKTGQILNSHLLRK